MVVSCRAHHEQPPATSRPTKGPASPQRRRAGLNLDDGRRTPSHPRERALRPRRPQCMSTTEVQEQSGSKRLREAAHDAFAHQTNVEYTVQGPPTAMPLMHPPVPPMTMARPETSMSHFARGNTGLGRTADSPDGPEGYASRLRIVVRPGALAGRDPTTPKARTEAILRRSPATRAIGRPEGADTTSPLPRTIAASPSASAFAEPRSRRSAALSPDQRANEFVQRGRARYRPTTRCARTRCIFSGHRCLAWRARRSGHSRIGDMQASLTWWAVTVGALRHSNPGPKTLPQCGIGNFPHKSATSRRTVSQVPASPLAVSTRSIHPAI